MKIPSCPPVWKVDETPDLTITVIYFKQNIRVDGSGVGRLELKIIEIKLETLTDWEEECFSKY